MKRLSSFILVALALVCAIQPAQATITTSPNSAGGSTTVSATNAISNQPGQGNGTNTVIWTTGNNGKAITLGTNDNTVGYQNGGIGLDLEFGMDNTNGSGLIWQSGAGSANNYAQLVDNPVHDGSPGSPAKSEMVLFSANRICLFMDSTGVGDDNGLQIGGQGLPGYMYLQNGTNFANGTGTGNVSPSIPLLFINGWNSNSTIYNTHPGFVADWPTSNKWESHFYIFHDDGRGGGSSFSGMGDKNAIIPGIDLKFGTNASVNYTGVKSYARLGNTTTILNVDTNGVDIGGQVTATNGLQAGTINVLGSSSLGIFDVIGGNVQVGTETTAALFEVSQDGSGGRAHDTFFSGGGGFNGSGFPLGGVSINTNNVAFSGDQLDVWGTARIPTNAAAIIVVSNFTASSPNFFTNNTSSRAYVEGVVVLTAGSGAGGASATCNLNFTISGTALQQSLANNYGNGTIGTNSQNMPICYDMGPGDYVQFSSGTSGAQSSVSFQQFHFVAH